MKVIDIYSHKQGLEFIDKHHPQELQDILDAIAFVNAADCFCKKSKEKHKDVVMSPKIMNKKMKQFLCEKGWTKKKPNSKKGFKEPRVYLDGQYFREMDGIKNKVGLEIQFGKYSFMGYDILSKMPIFASMGLIECGIEIVATSGMKLSTGVSLFHQIANDLKYRGVADLDIPTLILGIGLTDAEILAEPTMPRQKDCPGQKLLFNLSNPPT
jgi:hypothetical protein